MPVTPYLFFNGNCREAIEAYVAIFGGKIEMLMSASDMPPDAWPGGVPEDKRDWVMHAAVRLGGGQVMASDNLMEDSKPMDGCSVMIELPTATEGKVAFDRLAEGGEVTMAYEPTFWSAGFGTLRDRFGIRWMVGTSETPAGAMD